MYIYERSKRIFERSKRMRHINNNNFKLYFKDYIKYIILNNQSILDKNY